MSAQSVAKKLVIILGVFVLLAITHSAVARAQEVMVASGTVSLVRRLPGRPTNLKDGQTLNIGDTVRTETDGLVIIKYPPWPSDREGFGCRLLVFIGGGQSLRVSRENHPGICPETAADARERALRDRPVLSRVFFYDRGGDGKADSPEFSPLDKGVNSLIEGIRAMPRTFRGVLTINGGRVTVDAGGQPKSFVELRVTNNTQIVGAPSLTELQNTRVLVTYIIRHGEREAIKIDRILAPTDMVIRRRPPNAN